MVFQQFEDLFIFEKNEFFLNYLLSHVENGVIRDYPDFYTLEPLPQIIYKTDYNHVIIDGKSIPWVDMYQFTKDRLKHLVEGRTPAEEELIIERFYDRKYDAKAIYSLFSHFETADKQLDHRNFIRQIMQYNPEDLFF